MATAFFFLSICQLTNRSAANVRRLKHILTSFSIYLKNLKKPFLLFSLFNIVHRLVVQSNASPLVLPELSSAVLSLLIFPTTTIITIVKTLSYNAAASGFNSIAVAIAALILMIRLVETDDDDGDYVCASRAKVLFNFFFYVLCFILFFPSHVFASIFPL